MSDVLLYALTRDDAQRPERVRGLDAAYDLRCCEPVTIGPGRREVVDTGVAVALPPGVCGQLVGRSGLAARHGLAVLGGLIDAGYRGSIRAILLNTGDDPVRFDAGDRVVQMLLLRPWTPQPAAMALEDLPPASDGRGTDGFGSSGRA